MFFAVAFFKELKPISCCSALS